MSAPTANEVRPVTTTPDDAPEPTRRGGVGGLVEAYALVALTVGLVLLFSLLPSTSETFPTAANLQISLADKAILAVVALAVLVPIVAEVWDFTPGATMGLASVFAAKVVSETDSILLAVAVACAVGIAIGVINGLLVTRAKINSVIATLGMTILISGVVQWVTSGNSIVDGIPTGLTDFGSRNLLGIPVVVFVALVLVLAVYYVLRHTAYGRYLYALGSNRSAGRLVGIPVERLTMSTYMVSGLLAGIAGVLLLARTGAGNPAVGPGYTLPAFAVVFLGAAAITPGRWNVGGLVTAVLFLAALNSGLNLAGASGFVNDLANGTALIVGVGLANLFAHRRGRTLEIK
ncbi:MAG: ribose transport system permease protein [Thermoleophilaceae bacterium]|jgi:ribose transport system permease protein|nr:ribose transport system permease protein [Thermoleophilaceae bacterium]MEA2400187.1 ribose transport system permease protein [Thermoleophilaceae bacterium]